MLETVTIECPYCGEGQEATVDCSGGTQDYVEDCEVCCQPITFHVEVDYAGGLLSVVVLRDDETL